MITVRNLMSDEKTEFVNEVKAIEFAQKLAHGGQGRYAKKYTPVEVKNADDETIWSWTSLDATGR